MPDTSGPVEMGLSDALKTLKWALKPWALDVIVRKDRVLFATSHKAFTMQIVGDGPRREEIENLLPLDYLMRMPGKVAALVLGRLDLNKRVFARNCKVCRITKPVANRFLDRYHFMGATEAAFCYGLFLKEDLLAVATFSKGRKMRRLNENERSFELIRFCTFPGITVTGGLSKLMRTFCAERGAAEIMTYVDRQFSSGAAFLTAGFAVHEETEPKQFLINRSTFERLPFDGKDYDPDKFYVTENAGNIKMLFSCQKT